MPRLSGDRELILADPQALRFESGVLPLMRLDDIGSTIGFIGF